MSIFDTANSLIDLFTQGTKEDISAISNRSGVDPVQASSIVGVALPLILKAINNNTKTDEGLTSFDEALKQHENDTKYDTVAEYAQNVDTEDGDKMLGHLFNGQSSIIDKVADTLGITPAAVKRVLVIVAPILIKYLADTKKNNQLSPEQVRRQTTIEQERYQESTNNGGLLGGILGGLLDQLGGQQTPVTQNKGIVESLLDSLF